MCKKLLIVISTFFLFVVSSYGKSEPEVAFREFHSLYFEQAEFKKQDTVHKKNKVQYYYKLSIDKLKESFYIEALAYIDSAITWAQKKNDIAELADLYRHKAGILFEKNDINQSSEWLFKSLKIYDSLKDYEGLVATYNNLGLLYKNISDTLKAKQYYRKGIKLARQRNMFKDLAILYGNYGHLFKYEQPDSSLYYYNLSIELNKKIRDTMGMANNFYDIANIYAFYKTNQDSAYFFYRKAKAFAKNNMLLLTKILSSQAKFYYQNNNIEKSINLNRQVYELSKNHTLLKSREISTYYLYNAYRKLKKWDSAMFFLEDFVDTHDTIMMKNSQIQLQNLEAKYLNEKYKANLEILNQKHKRQKIIQAFLITFAVSLLVFVYLIFQTFKQKRKKLQIEKEKIDQELHFKTKQLMSQTALIAQKNKILDQIIRELSEIKTQNPDSRKKINKLKSKLKKILQSDHDWDTFKIYFEEIHKDFFRKLLQINPELTKADLKLAALIKLGFNIKETASLLYLNPDSIKTARYRLRKKLNLSKDEKLFNFLNRI